MWGFCVHFILYLQESGGKCLIHRCENQGTKILSHLPEAIANKWWVHNSPITDLKAFMFYSLKEHQ